MMAVIDAAAMIAASTPPELWTRRAGFSLMFSELLFENERQILAEAMHDLQIDPDALQVVQMVFKRTAALVLEVRP